MQQSHLKFSPSLNLFNKILTNLIHHTNSLTHQHDKISKQPVQYTREITHHNNHEKAVHQIKYKPSTTQPKCRRHTTKAKCKKELLTKRTKTQREYNTTQEKKRKLNLPSPLRSTYSNLITSTSQHQQPGILSAQVSLTSWS